MAKTSTVQRMCAAILVLPLYATIASLLGTLLLDCSPRFRLTPDQNGRIAAVEAAGLMLAPVAAANGEQIILQLDHSLVQAIVKGDKTAVDGLLDANFTWTDSDGVSSTKEQVLQDLASFARDSEGNTDLKAFSYGQVGAIFGVQHNARFERIWVKRPAGWRVLVYQQVPDRAPSTPAHANNGPVSADCENPCKVIPHKPTTDADRGVIASFEAMNTAIYQADADAWASHIGDEDFGITPGALVTKAGRIATLKKQKETNTPAVPPPLLSARFFDFGDTVVMTALHQPLSGKPHHFTRIWVKRSGVWLLVAGAQTEIQAAPATITH
jgi:hypothetical protein